MALIPPVFLNTVVALGEQSSEGKLESRATGFLYGHPAGSENDSGQKLYYVFLVTNRHVFQRAAERSDTLHARFNKLQETGSNVYPLKLSDDSWTVHPNPDVDVAVMKINADFLMAHGLEYYFFEADSHVLTREQAHEEGISEGDGVFVLGFPLGEAGHERNYVIVRQGAIARIQHWLKGFDRTFLIDASIFPGNSGGPVLLKPEFTSVKGTRSHGKCSFLGMVSSYLPYREVAISAQTGRQRMVFEENSGLGIVAPPDVIHEAIVAGVNKLRPNQPVNPSSLGLA